MSDKNDSGNEQTIGITKSTTDPQSTRFSDYFVICGLDLDTGLEPDRFSG